MSEFKFGDDSLIAHNAAADIRMVEPPLEGNLWFAMGEAPADIRIGVTEKRTVINRFKWWCFCRVFPFHIVQWEDR